MCLEGFSVYMYHECVSVILSLCFFSDMYTTSNDDNGICSIFDCFSLVLEFCVNFTRIMGLC